MSDIHETNTTPHVITLPDVAALAAEARKKAEVAHTYLADGAVGTGLDRLNEALDDLDLLKRLIDTAAEAQAERDGEAQALDVYATRTDAVERAKTLISASWGYLSDAQRAAGETPSAQDTKPLEYLADALAGIIEVVEGLNARPADSHPILPALEELWPELHGNWPADYAAKLRESSRAPLISDNFGQHTVLLDTRVGTRVGWTFAVFDDNASVLLRVIPFDDTDDEGRSQQHVSIRLNWQAMFRLVRTWMERRAQTVERQAAEKLANHGGEDW